MALNEKQKEHLRTLTVEYLLEVRRAYLMAGASPLKHWDQIQSRLLSAARRSTTADEWTTALLRGLQLPALSGSRKGGNSASRVLIELTSAVREADAAAPWLDLIQREYGLLMALTREAAEKRAEQYNRETGEMDQ